MPAEASTDSDVVEDDGGNLAVADQEAAQGVSGGDPRYGTTAIGGVGPGSELKSGRQTNGLSQYFCREGDDAAVAARGSGGQGEM